MVATTVTAWLQFMATYGLKRADEKRHPGDFPDNDQRSTRVWTNDRGDSGFCCSAISTGKIAAPDLERTRTRLGRDFHGRSRIAGRSCPSAGHRVLVGFDDVYEIEDRLREDVDRDLLELNGPPGEGILLR